MAVTNYDQLSDMLNRYNLAEIYAFGSRAQETAARLEGYPADTALPQSDLDIAVRSVGRRLSAQDRVDLTLELEDHFDVSRVDLVVLDEASPFLALEVIRGELLCARDLDDQARYELFVLRRAGDLLPFQKERITMVLKEGAR